MKKIYFLILTLLTMNINGNSQSNEDQQVAGAVETLKKAIVDADRAQLDAIAADDLVYGHSSGRVQSKAEFIEEIATKNPIDYLSVSLTDQTIKVSGNMAIVRHIYSSEIINNGAPGSLKIGNMLVFQKQNGKWRLLARQAYKLQ